MTPPRPARWAVPLAVALVACGGDGDSPTSTPEPTTGTVQVSAATVGDTLDQDGYTVTLDGGAEGSLDPDGSVIFEDVAEGNHEVAISDVQVNCATDGGATRTVAVTAGSTATTSFDVSCDPALFDRIVFHRDDGAGDADLLLVAPDGAGVTAIRGGDGFDLYPSISPDGTRVAFQDRSGPDSEIAVVSSPTTTPSTGALRRGRRTGPAWRSARIGTATATSTSWTPTAPTSFSSPTTTYSTQDRPGRPTASRSPSPAT